MKSSRSIKRRKMLEHRKSARKTLKKALRTTEGMPTACTFCGNEYDENSDPDLWMLKIENNTIDLQCPDCDKLNT